MKKLFRFIACFALPILVLNACRAEKVTDDKSLLWRISGNGLTKPSYLFGTIHLICKEDYFWTERMKKALAASDKVCFEMDMDDPEIFSMAMQGMADTSGKSLKDYFSATDYEHLKQFMQDSLEMDISQMPDMKPMMLEMMLSAKVLPCPIPESYEGNIMTTAQADKKEILGLESIQEQMNLVDNVPDDSAASGLMQLVDSFGNSKKQYAKMIASYKNQDLPALYDLVKKSEDGSMDLNAFLDERNKKWISRIEAKVKENSVFFAVGAAHLYGSNGVINLLRKAGFTVEPIR